MKVSDERVTEVCRLGPIKALELLDKGMAGDHAALAEWTIRALYQRMIALDAPPVTALFHARRLAETLEMKVSITK